MIWRQTPKVTGNGHFAHRIAFAPDGTIFLSSGDRQKMEPAQDPGSDLGKIIHMTAEGQLIGGRFQTLGHRNPLGLAFAPDGRLWSTEMGPQGGDEVNLIVQGRNYGWPRASNGSHYGGGPIPDHQPGDGFEAPKVWWNPSMSPGALLIYTGDKFPAWKGDALVGALVGRGADPCRHRRRQGEEGGPLGDGRAHPGGRPGPGRQRLSARRQGAAAQAGPGK